MLRLLESQDTECKLSPAQCEPFRAIMNVTVSGLKLKADVTEAVDRQARCSH